MQSRYPDHEPKYVFSQGLLLEALAPTGMGLPDLWDALDLTVVQRRDFFYTEPRVARMLRIQDFLGVDALSLVIPFDGLTAAGKKPGLKTGGRPARFRPEDSEQSCRNCANNGSGSCDDCTPSSSNWEPLVSRRSHE